MRRDLKAIVAAHLMDSRRRELYVEGRRDRLFFNWLLGPRRGKDAVVQEIDFVLIDGQRGDDNRAKLMFFAQSIACHKLAIRCFADADFDRVLRRPCPENVWLTDLRDLEGYFLQPLCVEKVLRLAMASERLTPEHVLNEVRSKGRPLGVLRLLSIQRGLKLPFKERPVKPYLKRVGDGVNLDFNAYLQSLLQGACVSLKNMQRIKDEHAALLVETKDVHEQELLHGRDCIAILCVLLKSADFKEVAVEPSFWTSLDREVLSSFESLEAAIEFLCTKRVKTS